MLQDAEAIGQHLLNILRIKGDQIPDDPVEIRQLVARGNVSLQLVLKLIDSQSEIVDADTLLFDVEDLRQFRISLSQDDAAFERQEHLSGELQDAVGVRPVDAQLPPVGGILGV